MLKQKLILKACNRNNIKNIKIIPIFSYKSDRLMFFVFMVVTIIFEPKKRVTRKSMHFECLYKPANRKIPSAGFFKKCFPRPLIDRKSKTTI